MKFASGSASSAILAVALTIAAPSADAQTIVNTYAFKSPTTLSTGSFSGTFTIESNSFVPSSSLRFWKLQAFSGAIGNYTFDLGNTGLNGVGDDLTLYGTPMGVGFAGPGSFDFYLEFNPTKAVQLSGVIAAGGPLSNLNTSFTLLPATSSVPEAGVWTSLLAGFGFLGAVLRRSRRFKSRVRLA